MSLLFQATEEKPTRIVSLSCPARFSIVGTACYRVTEEAVAGTAARAACLEAGGAPAIIESQQEMRELRG